MSQRAFFILFAVLHLVLMGGAYLVWSRYGMWAMLLTVLMGLGALQAWLNERRRTRRRDPKVGQRRRVR